jgi:hypothetical protein
MPNTPYNLTTNVTLESALPLDSDITSALQQATLLISGKLQQFADDSAFGDKIQVAFGTAVNTFPSWKLLQEITLMGQMGLMQ